MNKEAFILLIGVPGPETNILFHALANEFPGTQLIIEEPIPKVKFLLSRTKRYGIFKAAGQAMFMILILPVLNVISKSRKRELISLSNLNTSEAAFSHRISSINSSEAVNLIREAKPLAVVVCGTRIVSGKVLASVNVPFINIHAGITPSYRGVHGAYWALAEGNKSMCGVTVHLLDEGIDTGPVFAQEVIKPERKDNFATYPYLQLSAGIPLLIKALRRIQDGGKLSFIEPGGITKLRTHPTFWGYLWNLVTKNTR